MDYNIIPDQFSSEVISLMLLERAWVKVRHYLDNKEKSKQADDLDKRLANIESDIRLNTELDKRRDHEKRT